MLRIGVGKAINVHPGCKIESPSARNTQTPGTPILLVLVMLMIVSFREPGMVKWRIPSPALIPAFAGVPPSPFSPPDASPVVHSISA